MKLNVSRVIFWDTERERGTVAAQDEAAIMTQFFSGRHCILCNLLTLSSYLVANNIKQLLAGLFQPVTLFKILTDGFPCLGTAWQDVGVLTLGAFPLTFSNMLIVAAT